ncbi:MAG: DMT family transporter [Pseudomonadota bacterium]
MSGTKAALGKAVLISLTGILLLDVMAVLVKLLVQDYPAQQLATLRNLFAIIPPALLLTFTPGWRWRREQVVIEKWWLGFLRGGFITIAQTCFYISLSFMAFATASALTFTMSLFTTAISGPLLGHRVGPWRWGAVLIGFCGVMWILRPGSDAFTLAALLPVCAALFYAMTTVSSPLFPPHVPTAAINLYTNVAAMIGAAIFTLSTTGFVPIASWHDLGLIIAMGLFGGVGVLALIFAYRMTAPSNLSPFDYVGILFAFALGWIIFDEAPVDQLFPGVILIVAGGILILWRERVNAARLAAEQEKDAA